MRVFLFIFAIHTMQTWPTITIQHRRLALPQVAKTLNRYVTGVIKLNPPERTAQLLKLFADDPFFTTWVYALAAARGQHPSDLSELVEWMNDAGQTYIADLDPDLVGELQPPDAADSITLITAIVANSRNADHDLVAELAACDFAKLPATVDAEIHDALTQLAAPPTEQDGPQLDFSDLQKVLRWDTMEDSFQQQLHTQKMLAIKNFAYGASHEINNPLANISTRGQALLYDETDSDRQRSLSTIVAQAFRANAMIADLMLFAHPPTMKLERQNLQEIFQRSVEEMALPLEANNIQTELTGDSNIHVVGDTNGLFEMFKALLQNCADAMESGNITIGWTTQLDQVRIEIADNGPGIATDILPVIFDPFFSGREAGRGLGFGLSKAWRIAQIHHGSIEVKNLTGDSANPTGICVTVHLPESRES
ncbi:MAG TPA: HAMP domain-containing histidine kinase [Planctomycetes bacterium]|nr:HAMP domain-containing histidine kinase [Planctomycetota bacterium]